jgi:hypothetical protein
LKVLNNVEFALVNIAFVKIKYVSNVKENIGNYQTVNVKKDL